MSNLLRYDTKKNIWVYDGILTADKKIKIDEIIDKIKKEIPEIENQLSSKYKSSVLNKYYLGFILADYVKKFDLNIKERRQFWIEIGKLASTEKHKRTETNTSKRNYYEECLALSKLDINVVQKLSWRHWQSLLDRSDDYDDRLYKWIETNYLRLKQEEWRQFLKIHHMFMKDKDSTIFSDNEIQSLYDSFLIMAEFWIDISKDITKNRKAKKQKKSFINKSDKFYKQCFIYKKEIRADYVNANICSLVFKSMFNK